MPAKSEEALERRREAHKIAERKRREQIALRAASDPEFAAELHRKKLERNKRDAALKKARRLKAKRDAGEPDIPDWKKRKPGRIVALCGWSGW